MKLRPVFWLGIGALTIFNGGMFCQKYLHGQVLVFHNVDLKTPLNHGQPSVDIELPHGVKFDQFGSCGAHWKSRNGKIDWDTASIEIERYDSDTQSFVWSPPPGNVWVELVQ